MRIFHELVFDGYISGTGNFYSDQKFVELAGSVDITHISGYTAQVSGMVPTLNVVPLFSADGYITFSANNLINNLSLSASGETLFQVNEPYFAGSTTNGRMRFMRLLIYLGGSTPAAYLRLWMTGRDQSRRAKVITRPLTDLEQIHSVTG